MNASPPGGSFRRRGDFNLTHPLTPKITLEELACPSLVTTSFWVAAAKIAYDLMNIILLKQSDSGDSSSASIKAGTNIFQSYTTKGEHGNLFQTCFSQKGNASATRAITLAKYRPEHDQGCSIIRGVADLVDRVAGDPNGGSSIASAREFPDFPNFGWGNILGAQMHAIG